MSREQRINVQRSNYSVVDREFDSMRERFDSEMKRVEDEMNRLRREFETYTPPRVVPPPPLSSELSNVQAPSSLGAIRRYDPYLENIKSPLIREESDGKTLRLRFDVSQYQPEEVTVKTVDNKLLVHAKHEEKTPNRSVYREYNQEFMLPRGTNPEAISSTLSVDGVLTVESPLPAVGAGPDPYRYQIGQK